MLHEKKPEEAPGNDEIRTECNVFPVASVMVWQRLCLWRRVMLAGKASVGVVSAALCNLVDLVPQRHSENLETQPATVMLLKAGLRRLAGWLGSVAELVVSQYVHERGWLFFRFPTQ